MLIIFTLTSGLAKDLPTEVDTWLRITIRSEYNVADQVRLFAVACISFVGWSISSDDQQSHVGNDIEDQKDDFEQPEERVDNHVEGFSGNGKPFALGAVHQIRDQYTHYGPENQQGSIHDCTPHEECC